MNAVEIEEAVSELAAAPFDAGEFPFAFLTAFGNKPVTVQRLRAGSNNASDVAGGVLQRTNIHLAVCEPGRVGEALSALRNSPKSVANKVKFVLATDGATIEAEELGSGETIACDYADLSDHFGFFLPLAGISVVKEIKNNPFDIKATFRLNRLYIELLKSNPDWAKAERRHELNQFMARLIFCFFAEDTGIFRPGQFTTTIEQMSDGQSANTHEVLAEMFRAMDIDSRTGERQRQGVRNWADAFPHVNGGMFSGGKDCPRFSRMARTYLLHVGKLEWDKINPDIFGSMIQAVADDAERGDLGMHYTSVPNILKVLNPLFLDDLRQKLEEAGDSIRKLRNLRRRISRIRVFDPACGSGNFLVIAYKEMREIELAIIRRTGDESRSQIRLDNFFGIEIKGFAAEIARLALLIAEFQCDVRMIGQTEARELILPLHESGQIHVGNALLLDWLSVCPSVQGAGVEEWDLGGPTGRLALSMNAEGEANGPETYICGNPPYKGSKWQTAEQKQELAIAWHRYPSISKTTDYVAGWIAKYLDYAKACPDASAAFVATNSLVQGQQATDVWPIVFGEGLEIRFAHLPFKWSNLASENAGVTVIVVGLGPKTSDKKTIFDGELQKSCGVIGPYLIPDSLDLIEKANQPLNGLPPMLFGNMPRDGGNLFLSPDDKEHLLSRRPESERFIRRFLGSDELINGLMRYCLWIEEAEASAAYEIEEIRTRLELVRMSRADSSAESTRSFASRPFRFVQIAGTASQNTIVVPRVSSEARAYLPVGYVDSLSIIGDRNFGIYDAPLWNLGLIASRLHWVWIATVCVRLEMRFSYSNTLGWNTFPIPKMTQQNKVELTRCAEEILLARESHFPATIADLYDPDAMPDDLRRAHERNDEVLERIYIGRRFRNDTERLEKLFELYTKMSAGQTPTKGKAKAGRAA